MISQKNKIAVNLLLIPSLKSEMPTCENALNAINNRWYLCLFELIESKHFVLKHELKFFILFYNLSYLNCGFYLLCPCRNAINQAFDAIIAEQIKLLHDARVF